MEEWRSFLVYMVATAVLVDLSQAVVWGPRQGGVRGRGEIQPTVMEIPDASGESLSEAADKTVNRLRERRDIEDDDVGHTTSLPNDHHSFALVHWTGYPSEALFILTRRRTVASGYTLSDESWLWRSLDYGHTFENDTVKWDSDAIVEWYYISPFSEYLIFADVTHHRLYVTNNEGSSYSRSDIPFRPDRLTFQSRYAQNSTQDPYNKYVLGYDGQNRSLWVSLDLGMNWNRISDNVVAGRYYWRRMPGIDGLGTVYFEKNISYSESRLYWVQNVADPDGVRAEIFNRSLGNFVKNTFVLELEYMFVQKNSSDSGAQAYSSPLWVSHQRQMFKQARFPLETQEKHYAVVDASEAQVFIAVYHDINNTHLYLSEVEGLNYSLSLLYIISPPETEWENGYPKFDVHVVEGIVGTYIANQKVPGSRFGASVISYDKGGEWAHLIPPAVDSSGSPIICAPPECSLHLHMESDRNQGYQSILSQDSAVGLLMALGNLGSSLSSSSRYVKLYFSRDGGFTWFEVATGSWEFQFAALGSVIVTVRKRVSTNFIRWSCDEGHIWERTSVSNGYSMYVIGMFTEREEKARHVTIFGYNYSQREWLVVDLNFTSVVPNLCAMEDYFPWLPSDNRPGSRCLLGEVITYERRNSSFCCYINPEYDRPVNRTPCNCTIEDFECDFGFERINLNSPCSPLPWIQWPPPPPANCSEGKTYNISSGYRKVAGDKCVPGSETYFFELERQCPVLPPNGLVISYDTQLFRPNMNISFHLTQFQGWRNSTWYLWDFNDTSVPVNVTGYALGATQTHNFTMPRQYTVSVLANNNGGSSMAITHVTVYDIVTAGNINLPIQVGANASVPAGIDLVFRASFSTQYNTNVVGDVSYVWDFGDGSRPTSTRDVVISHTFRNPNTYSITLKIIAPYSLAEKATRQLHVYESAKHVQIVSDGLQQKRWVEVGTTIAFTVEKVPSYDEDIPPDTFYTWHLVPANRQLHPTEAAGREFNYTFPLEGDYALSVVGNHSAGSFATQIQLNAENYIGSVDVDATPTVRVGSQVIANVNPKQRDGLVYAGPLFYRVIGENGENLTDVVTANTDGSLKLQFSPRINTITKSKDIVVTFKFWNHISNSSVKRSLGVVVLGDYGGVSLKFAVSDLPSNYNTSKWLDKLRTGIVTALQPYHVTSSQIEIESTRHTFQDAGQPVTTANPDSLPQQHSNNILKRSELKQVFVVNVNILPISASRTNIQIARNISQQLVDKGALTVSIDGEQYKVEVEQRIQIIIEPPETVTVTNWQLYSGIGGGLGVVLILGVIISVVLGLIIYQYRRRYNRLQIRYSRLSQAPVRFTFTQSGDMLEEDDPDDFEAQDTTCAETDDQPLKQIKP